MLHWAVMRNHLNMVKMLLETTVNTKYRIEICNGWTISLAYSETFVQYKKGRSNPCLWRSNPNRGDYFGRTPLFLAV